MSAAKKLRPPMRRDHVEGFLEVGVNENAEVIVNLDKDRNGVGHIVFSPRQARHLARLLMKTAKEAAAEFAAAYVHSPSAPTAPPRPTDPTVPKE